MSAWGKGGAAKSCDALLRRVENNDPQLKELVILPSKTFGPSEANRLASAIDRGNNTNLTSISASGHVLPPSSVKAIATAISGNSEGNIESIALGDKAMGDDGAVALCEGLERSHGGKLKVVDFGWKSISKVGANAIGKTFGISPTLETLNLSRNEDMGDDGVTALCTAALQQTLQNNYYTAFPALQNLNLSECVIGTRGAMALTECLVGNTDDVDDHNDTPASSSSSPPKKRHLTLNLNSNPVMGHESLDKECIPRLLLPSPFLALVSLSLVSCDIRDDGIHALTSALAIQNSNTCCDGLRMLDLSKNGIGEEGAKSLGHSLSLHHFGQTLSDLRLAGNPLTTAGVENLCQGIHDAKNNTPIESLDLCQTSCGIMGAVAALRLHTLTSLRLFNNQLGKVQEDEGFETMSSVLRGGHVSLVNLDLGGNEANEQAVVCLLRALMDKSKQNCRSALRVLELGGNEIGMEAEKVLQEIAVQLPELDIARDKPKMEEPE